MGPEDKDYLIKYLLKLQNENDNITGSRADFGALASRYPTVTSGVNVGAGNKEMTPELAHEAGIGSSFGGAAAPGIPIDTLMQDMAGGKLNEEEMLSLRQLLSMKLHELAQQKIQRGF